MKNKKTCTIFAIIITFMIFMNSSFINANAAPYPSGPAYPTHTGTPTTLETKFLLLLYKSSAIINTPKKYTAITFKSFYNAFFAADDVYSSKTVTQQDIQTACDNLETAYKDLEQIYTLDDLNTLIFKGTMYYVHDTSDPYYNCDFVSRVDFNNKMAAAISLSKNKSATPAEIKQAYTDLLQAESNLVPKNIPFEEVFYLAEHDPYIDENPDEVYTADSLQKVLDANHQILWNLQGDGMDISPEIDQAYFNLQNAIENLKYSKNYLENLIGNNYRYKNSGKAYNQYAWDYYVLTYAIAQADDANSALSGDDIDNICYLFANAQSFLIMNPEVNGDVNSDGIINLKDVTTIQEYLANMCKLNYSQKTFADYDNDGVITLKDATAIQKVLAKIS